MSKIYIFYIQMLLKIKKKLGIKYIKLESLDEQYDCDCELNNINLYQNMHNDDEYHNEPIINYNKNNIEEKKINNLSHEDYIKRKTLLNKIHLMFENNPFIIDIYSKNKRDNDILYKYLKTQSPYYLDYKNIENNIIEKYINIDSCKKDYEKKNIDDIKYILNHYYIIFDELDSKSLLGNNDSKSFKRNAICSVCMDNIQIYEYECYMCGNIFFDKCNIISHKKINCELPLKQRYSKNFIDHIKYCTLQSSHIINEIYMKL
jgi:hypothetical protein